MTCPRYATLDQARASKQFDVAAVVGEQEIDVGPTEADFAGDALGEGDGAGHGVTVPGWDPFRRDPSLRGERRG